VPEGDTVWLTAHRLDQALAGREVTVFDLRVPKLATTDLRGTTVTGVAARGKHLLVRFDNDLTLHSHLKMDGSWYINRAGVRPRRHPEFEIRAQLGNADWLATGYRVHDLAIVTTADEARLVGHLGPDVLGPDWDVDAAATLLLADASVPIGEALLDQRKLAGVGNLYKSEVLFVERVSPFVPVAGVRDLNGLLRTVHRLMRANRDHPEQSTTGLMGRGQQHWVYGRRGEACRRCGTAIRRTEQGEALYKRSTYWCPTCQPDGSGG
jgi:endonuclease-8